MTFGEKKMGKTKKGMRIISYIGEIARTRGIDLKIFKKMAQDRDHYKKWINGPTLKGKRVNEEENFPIKTNEEIRNNMINRFIILSI